MSKNVKSLLTSKGKNNRLFMILCKSFKEGKIGVKKEVDLP
jgi:hypothetical protein